MSQLAMYLKRWYPEIDITLKPDEFKALFADGFLKKLLSCFSKI
jgi:hypothetical protein